MLFGCGAEKGGIEPPITGALPVELRAPSS